MEREEGKMGEISQSLPNSSDEFPIPEHHRPINKTRKEITIPGYQKGVDISSSC